MNSQPSQGEFSLQFTSNNGTTLILSVDDEPSILFTREKLLEAAGYKVLSAADGEAALNLFANNPVHLVLLDFAMPGMDGGAVAKELKRLNQTVPVIMVSASPLSEQALTCADCFVTKGQGPQVLLDQINQLLQLFPSTTRWERRATPFHFLSRRLSMKNLKSTAVETIQPADSGQDVQEQIRMRAFELYEQRGKLEGFDLQDWLQAEEEITGGRTLAQAA